MKFEDFKTKIETISTQITEFFFRSETEAKENLEGYLSLLKTNLQEKQAVLESLEKELSEKNGIHKKTVAELKATLREMEETVLPPKFDLEQKKAELEQAKAAELKTYLQTQKKKKNELIHKITNLKKELAEAHKENNTILCEEEKKYKQKENELIRRLNIDLERVAGNTVKQYIDTEKSLLEMNDPKEIEEAKKRINASRTVGYKEEMSVRNKYALSIFENELEFRKFQENIILDNHIKNEEYRLKVKNLEKEKRLIEIEEERSKAIFDFENERLLLNLEKENRLDVVDAGKQKASATFLLQEQNQKDSSAFSYQRFSGIKGIEREASASDTVQMETLEAVMLKYSDQFRTEFAFLIEKYKEMLSSCLEQMILLLDTAWNRKKSFYEELKNYLFLFLKERTLDSSYSYQQDQEAILGLMREFFTGQEELQKKTVSVLQQIGTSLLNQLESAQEALDAFEAENKSAEHQTRNKIRDVIGMSYRMSLKTNAEDYTEMMKKLNEEKHRNQKTKETQDELFKTEVQKVVREYQHNIRHLDQRIKTYLKGVKELENKENSSYKAAAKSLKPRIAELKRNYSNNLIRYEKELYEQYQEEVVKNETERIAKVKALN